MTGWHFSLRQIYSVWPVLSVTPGQHQSVTPRSKSIAVLSHSLLQKCKPMLFKAVLEKTMRKIKRKKTPTNQTKKNQKNLTTKTIWELLEKNTHTEIYSSVPKDGEGRNHHHQYVPPDEEKEIFSENIMVCLLKTSQCWYLVSLPPPLFLQP